MTAQGSRVLFPRVASRVHPPGGRLNLDLTVQNLLDAPLSFSRVEIAPSWAGEKRGIKSLPQGFYLHPHSSAHLTRFQLSLPSKPGPYTFRFGIETWLCADTSSTWSNQGVVWTDEWGPLQVTPGPIYTAFVSRSSRPEDAPTIQAIEGSLRVWGFHLRTVGVNAFSEDPMLIPQSIRDEVDHADALIAIATPRDYSMQESVYKTLSWLHVETGIAFHKNKPLLFIVDEHVKPEGLLEHERFPKVRYHPEQLEVLEQRLAAVMPGLRRWIAERRQQTFWNGVAKAAAIVGGIWLLGQRSD